MERLFMKGFTWGWGAKRGDYRTERAVDSMRKLKEYGCDMFCVGCEMIKTESQTARWTDTIARVREVYGGPLIYNANHGKEEGVE